MTDSTELNITKLDRHKIQLFFHFFSFAFAFFLVESIHLLSGIVRSENDDQCVEPNIVETNDFTYY